MSRRTNRAQQSVQCRDVLSQGLQFLEQIGEISNVPALKGVAGVLSVILEICNSAKLNKAESTALVGDIDDLVQAVAEQVEEHQDNIDEELMKNISHLCQGIEAVHHQLEQFSRRDSTLAWYVKYPNDEVILRRAREDVRRAMFLFSVNSAMGIDRTLAISDTQRNERQACIRGVIEEVRRDAIAELAIQTFETRVSMAKLELPTDLQNVFGRDAEIQKVVKCLTGKTAGRVAILGAAGIGKTSLVTKVLHNEAIVKAFGSHRFFVVCDGARGKDDIVTAIAGLLDVRGPKLQRQVVEKLGDSRQPVLLVLDNLETAWEPDTSKAEVEELLSTFAHLNNLSLIITMRGSERPGNVEWSRPFLPPLSPLSLVDARQAFLAVSEAAQDDPFVDELLIAVDCVPLPLTLMATMAQTDSTSSLLQRWRGEQSALLTRTSNRQSNLDVSIQISLNSPRLLAVPEAVHLLALLSLLPDGVDIRKVDVIFKEIHMPRRALSTLWRTSLAYVAGSNRTRVLAPIRAHMLLHHRPVRSASLNSVLSYYMGFVGIASELGRIHGQLIVERMTPDVGNFNSIIYLALDSKSGLEEDVVRGGIGAAIDLSRFTRYTHLGGIDTMRAARDAAERLGDNALLAKATFHLAWLTVTLKTADNKEELCNKAATLFEADGNIFDMSECMWLLGQVVKNPKQQKETRERALALAVQSNNKLCQAKCLGALSEFNFYKGDLDRAESQCQEALSLSEELQNLPNAGLCLYWMGTIAYTRSQYSKALRYLDRAIEALQKTGIDRLIGRCHILKGDIAYARCDFRVAQADYQRSLSHYLERDLSEVLSVAYSQLSLGEVAAAVYDVATSMTWIDAALKFFEKIESVHGILHCRMVLGDLAFYLGPGHFGEAEFFYTQALNSCVEHYKEQAGMCHTKLGALSLVRSRPSLAWRHQLVALSIYHQLALPRNQARAIVRLGDVYLAEGDTTTAIALYRAAYPVSLKFEAVRDVADCLLGIGRGLSSRRHVEEALELYKSTGDIKGSNLCRNVVERLRK